MGIKQEEEDGPVPLVDSLLPFDVLPESVTSPEQEMDQLGAVRREHVLVERGDDGTILERDTARHPDAIEELRQVQDNNGVHLKD